jgi:hypothetical protein
MSSYQKYLRKRTRQSTSADSSSKPPASQRDWFARAVSALALLLSGASFYYGNVRVQDELHARLVYHLTDLESGDTTFHVAVVNSGNRPAVLTACELTIDPIGEWDLWPSNINVKLSATFPIVVPPKDLRFFTLSVPLIDLSPQSKLTSIKAELVVHFHATDSQGHFHTARGPIIPIEYFPAGGFMLTMRDDTPEVRVF